MGSAVGSAMLVRQVVGEMGGQKEMRLRLGEGSTRRVARKPPRANRNPIEAIFFFV